MLDDIENEFDAALRQRLAEAQHARTGDGRSTLAADDESGSASYLLPPTSSLPPRSPLQFTLSAMLYSVLLIAAFLGGYQFATADLREIQLEARRLHVQAQRLHALIADRLQR